MSRRWSSPATSTSGSRKPRATAPASPRPSPAADGAGRLLRRHLRAAVNSRGEAASVAAPPGTTIGGFLPRSAGIGGKPSFLINTADVDLRYTAPELPIMIFTRLQVLPRLYDSPMTSPRRRTPARAFRRGVHAPLPGTGLRPRHAPAERRAGHQPRQVRFGVRDRVPRQRGQLSRRPSRPPCSRATPPGSRPASRSFTATRSSPPRRRSASTWRPPTAARSSRRCRGRRAA